jgi:hypothetical protein
MMLAFVFKAFINGKKKGRRRKWDKKGRKSTLTGLRTFVIKYVLSPAILRDSSRFSPKAGSTSNSPFKKLKVFSDMCTRLFCEGGGG